LPDCTNNNASRRVISTANTVGASGNAVGRIGIPSEYKFHDARIARIYPLKVKDCKDGTPLALMLSAGNMRSRNKLLGPILFFASISLGFAQDGSSQPCPEVTAGTVGCQLVAWSHLQEPVPLPNPETKPNQQPEQSQTQPQSAMQKITGIIVRMGDKYVLKAGGTTTYQLDDQERAKRYQDQQVTVVGALDTASNTIHVESIQLAS